jgi:hypothetical protein
MEHVPFMMANPSQFETTVIKILQQHDAELHQSNATETRFELKQQVEILKCTIDSTL